MKRLIYLVIILLLSVFLGLKIAEDPGYALFVYRNWTVEMPLWFAMLGLLVGLLVFFFILRFFDAIDASWAGWKNWLRLRRKHKSYSKTTRGLIELLEANWKAAENDLMSSVDQSDAPLINFLAAAKAAHEMGSYERRDVYLRKAYDLSPQTHIAVGLMQAQLQISQGKLEQAYATLDQLRNQAPRQVQVLKLLERVCIRLGDWKNLLKLVPSLRKANLITSEQMMQLEGNAYQELLQTTSRSPSSQTVRDIWKQMPRKQQKNPDVVAAYVKQLMRFADTTSERDELIVKTLKNNWHDDLVRYYGLLKTADAGKQLKTAEGWQKNYGLHASLSLTLARISIYCQLWGKAKTYFEECLKQETMPEAYFEYGNLLVQLHDSNAALQSYREGLKKQIQ